jgi:hypothetical protein
MFDIKNKPKMWYIEMPKDNEKYQKFVLRLDLETDSGYRILDHNAKFIFRKRGGNDNLELPCMTLKKYISQQDENIDFYIKLDLNNYNDLESLRMGGHLEVKLLIEEMFLIPFERLQRAERKTSQSATEVYRDFWLSQYTTSKPQIIIKYDATKLSDCELLILQDEWVEKLIKPLGMGDRFVVEIPCQLPDIAAGTPRDRDLKMLKERLERGMDLLKKAISEYNAGKDHKKCITNIREVSDILHKLGHDKTKSKDLSRIRLYGEYLIENTGTGSNQISQEIIESTFAIIDKIFDTSSKVPHGVNKKGETFDYTPDYEDAEMLLGITTLVYFWLSKKFEESVIKS